MRALFVLALAVVCAVALTPAQNHARAQEFDCKGQAPRLCPRYDDERGRAVWQPVDGAASYEVDVRFAADPIDAASPEPYCSPLPGEGIARDDPPVRVAAPATELSLGLPALPAGQRWDVYFADVLIHAYDAAGNEIAFDGFALQAERGCDRTAFPELGSGDIGRQGGWALAAGITAGVMVAAGSVVMWLARRRRLR